MPTLFIGKLYNPHIGIFTIGNIFVPCTKHVTTLKLIFAILKLYIHNKKYIAKHQYVQYIESKLSEYISSWAFRII